MKRLTTYRADGRAAIANNENATPKQKVLKIPKVIDRLASIEDILGDEYDLDRLRELAQADREGRCVVFQPGYDVVSIYNPADEDGLYTMSTTGVITKEEYEAALRREQDG